jgi:hypothetical protein
MLLGLSVQIPLAVGFISRQVHLTADEIRVAVSPISELMLPSVPNEEQHQFRVEIPADRGSWHRIVRFWGEAPLALIATSGDQREVLDLTEFVTSVEISNGGQIVATRSTRYAPYRYSSAANGRALEFDKGVTDEFVVRVNLNPLRPRDSKLQVFRVWRDVAIKDALDSAIMDDELVSAGWVASAAGGLVLVIALGAWLFQRARP